MPEPAITNFMRNINTKRPLQDVNSAYSTSKYYHHVIIVPTRTDIMTADETNCKRFFPCDDNQLLKDLYYE